MGKKTHYLYDSSFCAATVIICVKLQHYKERHLEKIQAFIFNKILNWDPVQFCPFCHNNGSVCSFCNEWADPKIAYCYQPNLWFILFLERTMFPWGVCDHTGKINMSRTVLQQWGQLVCHGLHPSAQTRLVMCRSPMGSTAWPWQLLNVALEIFRKELPGSEQNHATVCSKNLPL